MAKKKQLISELAGQPEHSKRAAFVRETSGMLTQYLYRVPKYELLEAMIDAIFEDFGLTTSGREYPDEVLKSVSDWKLRYYEYVELCPLTDLLGSVYMEIQNNWRGTRPLAEYYTPQEVSRMMAQMVLGDELPVSDDGVCRFSDPCVGSGSMPLSFAEAVLQKFGPEGLSKISITGIDISHFGIRLCACQFLANLYVHGFTFAEIALVHGDSLVFDPDNMTVILHATRPDLQHLDTTDPRNLLLANKDALAAQAHAQQESWKSQGVDPERLANPFANQYEAF